MFFLYALHEVGVIQFRSTSFPWRSSTNTYMPRVMQFMAQYRLSQKTFIRPFFKYALFLTRNCL